MNDRNDTSLRNNDHVLSFEKLHFNVPDGKGVLGCCGDKEKTIIGGVSGTARSGQMVSLMGPSGAGKTTLLNILSLRATYGRNDGRLLLDGVRLDSSIFKSKCFLVEQRDRNWGCLTVEETCTFAARLFANSGNGIVCASNEAGNDIKQIVDNILNEVGLKEVARSRNSKLSGGQQRRLSLAIALLKQPAVLFLDEITSGLDSASADKVCKTMRRIADEENILIICTIHQPSTSIFLDCFDNLFLLANGRVAYAGETKTAHNYFRMLGYPVPPMTNPAEHYLELVNSDFGCPCTVKNILDFWEKNEWSNEKIQDNESISVENQFLLSAKPIVSRKDLKLPTQSFFEEFRIVMERQLLLTYRDPILYLGRCVAVLLLNSMFGFVYWNGRPYDQEQVIIKGWIVVWYVAIASMMGCVVVYFVNGEISAILSEQRNGMVTSSSYFIAKTVLSVPFIFIYSLFALGIPGYVVQDFQMGTSTWRVFLSWISCMYVFESFAECVAVWFKDPILGVLVFLSYWIANFLFGGIFLPLKDIPTVFEPLYHGATYSYYIRSTFYSLYSDVTFEPCDRSQNPLQPICVENGEGSKVVEALHEIFPVFENEDTLFKDVLIMGAQIVLFKILFFVCIYYRGMEISIPNSTDLNSKYKSSLETTMSATKVTKLDESDEEDGI